MMLEVPTNTEPSSVSNRLCFPSATLYSLLELQGDRADYDADMCKQKICFCDR